MLEEGRLKVKSNASLCNGMPSACFVILGETVVVYAKIETDTSRAFSQRTICLLRRLVYELQEAASNQ